MITNRFHNPPANTWVPLTCYLLVHSVVKDPSIWLGTQPVVSTIRVYIVGRGPMGFIYHPKSGSLTVEGVFYKGEDIHVTYQEKET